MAKKLDNKAVKAPAGAPPTIVLQQIETRPVNRTQQDIPNWRQAIQSAESITPRRTLLYSLYADVVLDGHVIAVKGKRIDACTTATWKFVDKAGKPIDEINDIIDSAGFDDVITEIMESKFWGYSILEPKFWKNHDDKWEVEANLLPRLNYRPEKGIVAYQATGDDGVNIREGIYAKTVMEVGKTSNLGLLISAAQYAILKRGGIGDWAMFVQVFGRPIVDATWDGFDEGQRLKLQKALDIGPGGVIIRPDGTTVNLLDGANGQSNVHGDLYKAMNSEISKGLLGTTETTEGSDSSGYAQSKTHSEQDENKHESDISFCRKTLNSRFTLVLKSAGFDTKGGRFIIQGDEVRLDKKESFEIHSAMKKDLGIPMSDDFFYEEYDVAKPDNYDQLKKAKEAKANEPIDGGSSLKDFEKKPKTSNPKPKADEVQLAWYQKLFTKLFPTAPAETTGATNGHPHTIDLAFADDFDNDALIQRIFDQKGTLMFDKSIYEFTVKKLLKAFKSGFSKDFVGLQFAPGFSYDVDDPGLIAAFEQNLFRFAGAKTLAQLTELNKLFRSGLGFNRFYEEAQKIMGKYNRDWLLTEYNTAILVAQSTATYNRLYAQKDVFPYWLYKTAGDELVRHSHTLLEGLILRADDPRWKKIYPPNGFNCRCYVVPRQDWEVKDVDHAAMSAQADIYLDSPAFERENGRGWGMNKSELGIVFTPDQQYKHPTPGETEKQLNSLEPKHYELPSAEFATKEGTEALPTFDDNVTEWLDALETIKNVKVLRDWQKRPVNIDTTNFNRTIATQADKGKLIAALNETLSSPDEVWINGDGLGDMVYIKYYKGETFIAIGKVHPGHVVLDNWIKVQNINEALSNYRKGLLMFSNK